MNRNQRIEEITTAVDHLIASHAAWESDPEYNSPVPSQHLADAISDSLDVICFGDVPSECQDIHLAGQSLRVCWGDYSNQRPGAIGRHGEPTGRLWAAFRNLVTARESARAIEPHRPEPVSTLQSQGVTSRQIAIIYGTRIPGSQPARHTGIFFDHQSRVREDLIDQQAKFELNQPGGKQIVPDGWVHPDELARIELHNGKVNSALDRIRQRIDGDTAANDSYEDPASVEDMLREGAFPGQIAKAKNTTVQRVNEIARKINLKPNSPDNPKLWNPDDVAPGTSEADSSTATASEPGESDNGNKFSDDDINQLIIDECEKRGDIKPDSPDVARTIKGMTGVEVNAKKVASVWRHHRARQSEVPESVDPQSPSDQPQGQTVDQVPVAAV